MIYTQFHATHLTKDVQVTNANITLIILKYIYSYIQQVQFKIN